MNTLPQEALETKENEYWVEMKKSLEVLHKCPHFNRVILDGYFKDKAINGVSVLASPSVITDGKRSEVMEELIAISRLQDYFIMINNIGSVDSYSGEE